MKRLSGVLVGPGDVGVEVGDAAVGVLGVLRARLLGGLPCRTGAAASVFGAFVRGAGSVVPPVGVRGLVGLHGHLIPHTVSGGASKASSAHTRVPASR